MITKIVFAALLFWIVVFFLVIANLPPGLENGPTIVFGLLAVVIIGIAASIFAANKWLSKKFTVSDEKQRYMAFGSIILGMSGESYRMFKIMNMSKGKTKTQLRDLWDIRDRNGALDTAKYLSTAEGHTPFTDDIYINLVKKGNLELLKKSLQPEDLQSLKEENARQVDRIKHGILVYEVTRQNLIKNGYTENELSGINSTAAWDFGRTAQVARYSAHAGYLQEDEAWEYIKTAAENATKVYANWREYVAGYLIGRSIGYGNFLPVGPRLFGKNSPFSIVPFKL